MFSHYNSDTAGVTRKKETPALFNLNLQDFQEAADWVKAYLLGHGYDVQEVVLEPYSQRWMFYTAQGEFVIALSHELMERALGVLLWKEYIKEK